MRDTKREKNLIAGVFCALGCEIIYGLSYLFTKQATEVSSSLSLLCWRFAIAFITMTLLISIGTIKINLRGKRLAPLIKIAFFSPVIYFIGETIGISNTTATESGIFLASIPVAAIIASTLILKKKPTRLQVIGLTITFVGVILTVLAVGLSSSFSIIGYIFLTIAVISYSLYCVFVDKTENYTELEITYIMLVAGAIVFIPLALVESIILGNVIQLITLPFRNTSFMASAMYQGIGCSIIAFFLSNMAIEKIGVNKTSTFVGISTVVSILAGVVILQESMSILQIIGAAIIIIGVYVANAPK